MLVIGEDNSIQLTRGDTAYLQVPIYNDITGEEYVMAAGDKLTFSVKQQIKDTKPCIQKESVGVNTFKLCPEDTCNCAFGAYKYDVQLVTEAGDVFTVIEPTMFKLSMEVTT